MANEIKTLRENERVAAYAETTAAIQQIAKLVDALLVEADGNEYLALHGMARLVVMSEEMHRMQAELIGGWSAACDQLRLENAELRKRCLPSAL